jgi:hypothetical protein
MTSPASKKTIILTSPPKGSFGEGYLTVGAKPGVCIELDPNAAMQSGRFGYRPFSGTLASGAAAGVMVLLEDDEQGFVVGTPYLPNSRCRFYTPAPGEELNVLRLDRTGTGDSQTIGQQLEISAPSGKVIAQTGSGVPYFQAMESIVNPTSDQLTHVLYIG